jgi:hypothetical protein
VCCRLSKFPGFLAIVFDTVARCKIPSKSLLEAPFNEDLLETDCQIAHSCIHTSGPLSLHPGILISLLRTSSQPLETPFSSKQNGFALSNQSSLLFY